MYVILVYDISTVSPEGRKRLPKVMKTCRQYLRHTQKSVFEGEITEAKLYALKGEIRSLIDTKEDYVVVYELPQKAILKRENIGIEFDPTNRLI